MKELLVEVRARVDAGYSARQLMSSLIPDIGTELKVAASEVTAALKDHKVAFPENPPWNNYILFLLCPFLFSLHQHRIELVFHRGPAAELFFIDGLAL